MTTPAPPTVEQVAAEHAVQTGLIRAMALNAAMQIWSAAPRNLVDLMAWWFGFGGARDQLLTALGMAQEMVAAQAPQYVEDTMGVQGWAVESPTLVPDRFAATASDGRSLETLLDRVVFQVDRAVQQDDRTVEEAIREAEPLLQRIVHTQVTDASREADGVMLATSETAGPIAPDWSPSVAPRQQRPPVSDREFLDANEIVDPWARRRREQELAEAKRQNRSPIGWIRMLSPPSCGRCAVLAGRWYGWNEGFQRHPNCDCRHIPAIENDAESLVTDPRLYFDSLSRAEQDELFGTAAADAIRNGADIAQVINAQNRQGGSYTVDGRQYTREGTTRRGYYGGTEAGQNRRRRPTPVQIYRDARGDRQRAVSLLTEFGYIVP